MKIAVDKIDEGKFVIREETDQEHLKQLSQSLLDDGQWNPIIVRPKPNGRYEVIAGHYRLQAAKNAGLKEIEATVRDLSDSDADVLSLKTNMLRLEMTAREQGKVLSQMMEKHGWSQKELGRRLNVDPSWISRRIRVALELHEQVAKALDEGKISMDIAGIISGVAISQQPALLKVIIDRGITQSPDASKAKQQFLNNTIFTIGYQGRSIEDFVEALKKSGVNLVIDARFSADSQYKPEFSGDVLRKELERNSIKYEHHPELGIPFVLQNPYKEGAFSYPCLKQWYSWHLNAETNFDAFIEHIKRSGNTALMCMERYAKAYKEQAYACHRDILADLILDRKISDPLLKYEKRTDL
ncbi:MAG: ParB/RepB/Spo0J family partition protein [Candidatus Bathyarchaeia archaeon]|jgi:ParB family chromosome partitioning protein